MTCAPPAPYPTPSRAPAAPPKIGQFVDGDFLTALLAESLLQKNPGEAILYDVRASRAVPDTVTRAGGTPQDRSLREWRLLDGVAGRVALAEKPRRGDPL